MLKVFVRPAAREELAEAFRWYEARAVGLGHEYLRAVRVAFGALERTPELDLWSSTTFDTCLWRDFRT